MKKKNKIKKEIKWQRYKWPFFNRVIKRNLEGKSLNENDEIDEGLLKTMKS